MENDRELWISQCMIVKNEEANIGNALSWGKGLVGEQIVVDTGSTDRTAEIAASMGAVVYPFAWIDDFAAAKNFAISKAKGKWIAFLDADEIFAPGDEKKLPGILARMEAAGAEALSTGWMQLGEDGGITAAGTQIRVFRNLPGLEYRRRIHEQLEWRDKTPLRVADATNELSILHTGYRGAAWKEKTVSGRNLKLILKELEDHPGDHEMMGYLGDEYNGAGYQKEAARWYRKAIAAMPDHLDARDQRSAATFLYLMQILDSGQMDEMEETEGAEGTKGAEGTEEAVGIEGTEGPEESDLMAVYQKAVYLLPEEADFDYLLGRHFVTRKNYADGGRYLERAIGKLENFGCYNRAMMLVSQLSWAYEKLALCCLMTGEREKAVSYSVAVLRSQPYSMEALCILLEAFRADGVDGLEILGFLDKLYQPDLLKNRLYLLKAASRMGLGELERLMEERFTPVELDAIHGAENGIIW